MEVKLSSQERKDVREFISCLPLVAIHERMSMFGYSDEEIGRCMTSTLILYKALGNSNEGPQKKKEDNDGG